MCFFSLAVYIIVIMKIKQFLKHFMANRSVYVFIALYGKWNGSLIRIWLLITSTAASLKLIASNW